MVKILCSVMLVAVVAREDAEAMLQGSRMVFVDDAKPKNVSVSLADTSPHRCTWSTIYQDKYIGGCSKNCARFVDLGAAKAACDAEETCGGVTLEHGSAGRGKDLQWELRSGPKLAATPSGKGENSYVCGPAVTSRCIWSTIYRNKYIGGCSKNCARFVDLGAAKAACDAEETCGGVTLEHGSAGRGKDLQWELRSGPKLAATPRGKGENSYVCTPAPPPRCTWSKIHLNKYIGGCSKNCARFVDLGAATAACDAEETCGGVTLEHGSSGRGKDLQWELRSGPKLAATPTGKGENSFVCTPAPPPRCTWSTIYRNKYVGGCSKNCARFVDLGAAKAACNAEETCGGVTLEHGSAGRGKDLQWELRSGPRLAATPSGKGENSYVCG